jgi:predicted RNA polymerase sigma factor
VRPGGAVDGGCCVRVRRDRVPARRDATPTGGAAVDLDRGSAGQPRDWQQIAALYDTLVRQTGSPIVKLNRAIAVAELEGPEAGLTVLDGLELDHYRYFHSARAELLRRAGRDDEAGDAYRRALDLVQTDAERRSLQNQLARLSPPE